MKAREWHSRAMWMTLAVGIAVTETGCASGAYDPAGGPDPTSAATLRVENRNFLDVGVYMLRDGSNHPIRVATVPGLTSARIRLHQRFDGQVRMLLRPIGSRDEYLTNHVFIAPGQTLELTVGSQLYLSQLIAW